MWFVCMFVGALQIGYTFFEKSVSLFLSASYSHSYGEIVLMLKVFTMLSKSVK